jgi:hypothetical protein
MSLSVECDNWLEAVNVKGNGKRMLNRNVTKRKWRIWEKKIWDHQWKTDLREDLRGYNPEYRVMWYFGD